jgi:Caspase recruitment domain
MQDSDGSRAGATLLYKRRRCATRTAGGGVRPDYTTLDASRSTPGTGRLSQYSDQNNLLSTPKFTKISIYDLISALYGSKINLIKEISENFASNVKKYDNDRDEKFAELYFSLILSIKFNDLRSIVFSEHYPFELANILLVTRKVFSMQYTIHYEIERTETIFSSKTYKFGFYKQIIENLGRITAKGLDIDSLPYDQVNLVLKCEEFDRRDELSAKLENCASELTRMIDIEHGLLDELISLKVLSNNDDVERITAERTTTDRISRLTNHVIGLSDTHQRHQFLLGLDNTGQKHVKNFIEKEGKQREEADFLNWPLPCDDRWNLLHYNRPKLIEFLDSENGLFDEMLASHCITERHFESIRRQPCDNIMNQTGRLIDVLQRRSVGDFETFIRCLHRTNQPHVASLLTSETFDQLTDECRMLNDEEVEALTSNRPELIDKLDLDNGLVPQLYSAGFLTRRQKDSFRDSQSKYVKNELMLDMLRRGSRHHFNTFVLCLRETGQDSLSRLLSQNAADPQHNLDTRT